MSKKGTRRDKSAQAASPPEVGPLAQQVRQEVLAELLRQAAGVARQVPKEQTRKFTTAAARRLLTMLAAGAARENAGWLAGISASTLISWMKWGAEGRAGFTAFHELVRRAESLGAAALTCKVFDEPSWHSATWMLERKLPLRWGPQRFDLVNLHVRLRKIEQSKGLC